MAKKFTKEQLLKVENALTKMYEGVFTKRELTVERTVAFRAIGQTKSQKTGLWLSEAIPDDEQRANLIGAVVDRLTHQLDVGF